MIYNFHTYNSNIFDETPTSIMLGKWQIDYLSFSKEGHFNKIPLIFIRGAFQEYSAFKDFVKEFVDDFPIIIIQLPGEGGSHQIPEELEIEDFADLVNSLMLSLKIKKANIISTSYGSFIAYVFAKKYPQKIEKIILGGTTPSIRISLQKFLEMSIFYGLCGDHDKAATLSLGILVNFSKENFTKIPGRVKKLIFRTIRDIDRFSALKSIDRTIKNLRFKANEYIDAEALIYVGEFDSMTTPNENIQVARKFLKSHFAIFKNADHLLPIIHSDKVISLYRSFLMNETPKIAIKNMPFLKLYAETHTCQIDRRINRRFTTSANIQIKILNKKKWIFGKLINISNDGALVLLENTVKLQKIPDVITSVQKVSRFKFFRFLASNLIKVNMSILKFKGFPAYELNIVEKDISIDIVPLQNGSEIRCFFLKNNFSRYEAISTYIEESKISRLLHQEITDQPS
jgi:pimeloyl-ACP methyl ester carboxylesterase